MILTSLTKYREAGLLVLRVALGIVFVYAYGWPHLSEGSHKWREMGRSIGALGIHFAPVLWGFAAAFSESVGAVLFALGFLFRPACMLLAFTMFVAALSQMKGGIAEFSHPLELCILFFSMIFIGPGKYSVDKN
ncbi:MAG TPA: DoxX family protein [Chthoniobacteraceae bacterium]|nr:DoxX family protein [Chthoniobacteraceae bacterium]